MTRLTHVLILAAGLTACSPEPRSTSYFGAHREEAAKVAAACKTGAHRGEECVNAELAMIKAANEARMEFWRRGFEKPHG